MATRLNQKLGTNFFPFFWLMLSLAALLFWVQPAHASRVINSVTLNGGASVVVDPGTSISATLNVTTDNGGGNPRWRSSDWLIATAPAAGICVNHTNYNVPGTYTHTFNITAPTLAGTYNAYFIGYNDNSCAGNASPLFTVVDGVTVTSPVVTSILLNNPNPTALASVSWTVTFNRSVTGVTAGDFSLAVGGGVSGASITSVTGSGTTWTVTASTGSGAGTLGLNLVDNDTVVDAWTNPLGGTGAGDGNYTGAVYTVLGPLLVTSIALNNPSPTALASVSWIVTFNRSVTGVDSGDFSLVAGGGVSGASITSVTGSGTTWTVTASTGSGDGTLGLNLIDNDTIVDAYGFPLGRAGAGNGNFTGAVYTITKVSQFDVVEVTAARATPIRTKIAGANFSLDILALNAANVISTGYTGTVTVALVDASSGACAGFTTIQAAFSVTFAAADNGRKTVSFNYANSWPNVRVRVISASPAITSCSTDNFAIRPADFTSVSATDATWQTAGTANTLNANSASGTPIHKAGRPFTLRATAVTTLGATASNYAGSPAVTVLSSCGAATACAPSVGTLAPGTWGANPGPAASGNVVTNTASYDEVGAFNLLLQDQTFANVDVIDTPATCSNVAPIGRYLCQTTAVTVGRFVPNHFTVAYNTPQLGTACGTTFTYVGQPFNYTTAPVITVTARNLAGGITSNYSGVNLWRLTDSSLTYPAAVVGTKGYAVATGVIDTGLVPVTDPGIAQTAGSPGVGTLTFSSGTGLGFTRGTPLAPFNAEISLQKNIIDLDGVAYASNPANFGIATAGNGIAFNNTKLMRYVRLRISNAYGSNLLPLPVPLITEFATSANSFALNSLDSCTTVPIPVTGTGLTYTGTGSTTASLNAPFVSGNGGLVLSAPGAANTGFADIVINAPSWLEFDWLAATAGLEDPRARATFTQYKKANQFIYMREN